MIDDKGIVTVLLPLQEDISKSLEQLVRNLDINSTFQTIHTILKNLVKVYDYLYEYNLLELERLHAEFNKLRHIYRGLSVTKKHNALQEKLNNVQESIEVTKQLIWKYKLLSLIHI